MAPSLTPGRVAASFKSITRSKKPSSSWTDVEIEALGLQFREGADDAVRRRAFDKLLAGLTADNARKVREQIEHLSPDSKEYREFHHTWGRVAGKAAVLNAGKTSRQATAATLTGWASMETTAALEFFDRLQYSAHNGDGSTNHFSQEYLRLGLVEGLAEVDTTLATTFVQSQFENQQVGEKKVGDMIRSVANRVVSESSLAEAAAWTATVPEALRNEALAGVAREYAATDIEATLNWLGSLGDEIHQGAAYYHTFDTWMREDPAAASEYIAEMPESYRRDEAISALTQRTIREDAAAALAWTKSIRDPASRNRIMSDTFNTWAVHDVEAASAYLTVMPLSPERDHAMNGFAGSIAKEDPSAAVAWADQIGDAALREAALTTVALSYFETDPTAASAWLPESGLPNETIARVSNPSPEDLHQMKYLSR